MADAVEVNANFSTIANEINGQLNTVNLTATLAFSALDFVDLALIVHDSTAIQGLRLPQIGGSPSSPSSGEGFIGWDQTNNTLEVYDGSSWVIVNNVPVAGTQGDVLYDSGTAWTALAVGTAGQTLTTGGASANPAWSGMTTQGDVEYHNGTTRTRLAAGTANYFFQTKGAGQNPVWAQVPGVWKWVETLSTSSGTSVTSATLPTDSNLFMVVFDEVGCSSAANFTFSTMDRTLSLVDGVLTDSADGTIGKFASAGAGNVNGLLYVPRLATGTFRICPASIGFIGAGNTADVTLFTSDQTSAGTFTTLTFSVSAGAFDNGNIYIYKLVQ